MVKAVSAWVAEQDLDWADEELEELRMSPAAFEVQFMRLHAEGRFGEMWEMLSEDSQRAWGERERFMHEMPRLDADIELVDMRAVDVTILDEWVDRKHERHYSNVARLLMRYRVRQQWREWTFDRQVHLLPDTHGWRTLCYPNLAGAGAGR